MSKKSSSSVWRMLRLILIVHLVVASWMAVYTASHDSSPSQAALILSLFRTARPLFWLVVYPMELGILALQYHCNGPLVSRFVIESVYLPAMFFLVGTLNWSIIYLILFGLWRSWVAPLLLRIFCRAEITPPSPDETASPPEIAPLCETVSVPCDDTSPCERHRCRWPGRIGIAVLLIWFVAAGIFISKNLHRCRTWERDFHSARIGLPRFFMEHHRYPTDWSELQEGTSPKNPITGRFSLADGEHYAANPGVENRMELNHEWLMEINRVISENSGMEFLNEKVWVFRIRPHSPTNRTGRHEPAYNNLLWDNPLRASVANDLFHYFARKRAAHPSESDEAAPPLFDEE